MLDVSSRLILSHFAPAHTCFSTPFDGRAPAGDKRPPGGLSMSILVGTNNRRAKTAILTKKSEFTEDLRKRNLPCVKSPKGDKSCLDSFWEDYPKDKTTREMPCGCFTVNNEASRDDVEAKKKSHDIDNKLKNDQEADNSYKLLLLGAGESGKSTFFKQMKILHKDGFSEEERLTYKEVIHSNTVLNMKTLINGAELLEHELEDNVKESADIILEEETSAGYVLTPEIAEHIKKLWESPAIQATFAERSKLQLSDEADHFFNEAERMAKPDYIPTEKDVLRVRVRTTGIIEQEFEINNAIFKMFDVGGQRNERRKWIHCFEDVTAVIFMVSLAEYDQVLYEDETQNRMKESLHIFDEICNSNWFQKTSIILFLNKVDLFKEKIKKVDLDVCFEDYNGSKGDYQAAVDFIKQKFISLNKSKDKQIYCKETCATDTRNCDTVFNAVKDIVLQNALREYGLV